jgi:hypothetical protein
VPADLVHAGAGVAAAVDVDELFEMLEVLALATLDRRAQTLQLPIRDQLACGGSRPRHGPESRASRS